VRPREAATGCEVLRCWRRRREEGSSRNLSSVDGWRVDEKALALDVDRSGTACSRRAAAGITTRIFGPANIAESPEFSAVLGST
jgi:hypothetical protein